MPKPTTVSIVIKDKILDQLDKIAAIEDRSRSYVVCKILQDNIDKYIKECSTYDNK